MMSHRQSRTSAIAEAVFIGLCLLVMVALVVFAVIWVFS